MSSPIPKRLQDEFIGFMQDIYEDDDLPDGAWFCMLEEQPAPSCGRTSCAATRTMPPINCWT